MSGCDRSWLHTLTLKRLYVIVEPYLAYNSSTQESIELYPGQLILPMELSGDNFYNMVVIQPRRNSNHEVILTPIQNTSHYANLGVRRCRIGLTSKQAYMLAAGIEINTGMLFQKDLFSGDPDHVPLVDVLSKVDGK